MRTLIVYSTKHGATRKYAEALARELPGEVTLVDLRKDPGCDVSLYETVVIGGAIYYGQVQKELREFCLRHLEALRQKRLGLFTCCLLEGERDEQQLQGAFPGELRDAALARKAFGGVLDLTGLSFVERLITRVVGLKESVTHYSKEAARQFAQALQ